MMYLTLVQCGIFNLCVEEAERRGLLPSGYRARCHAIRVRMGQEPWYQPRSVMPLDINELDMVNAVLSQVVTDDNYRGINEEARAKMARALYFQVQYKYKQLTE